MSDNIIQDIINACKKYDCPKDIDCENKHAEFWLQCFKTGLKEIEVDLSENNIKKEFADMAMIAIDGLNKLGYNPEQVIRDRLIVNSKKDMSKRNINFYVEKEKQLDNLLGDNKK